jgi:hypothetical protein
MPDRIRVIEYEILYWDELEEMEEISEVVVRNMGRLVEVGVLRCTLLPRTKVTLVGGADATRALIATGEASKPRGMPVSKADFPVMIDGWHHRTDR